jgi:hypothetical protein
MTKHRGKRHRKPVEILDRPEKELTACQAMEALGDVVYAIRLPDDTIKIGWTTNLAQRKRSWRMPGNTGILAVKPGTCDEEQAIHQRLTAYLQRGREYYHPTPEVLAEVNSLRDAVGLEHVAG